LVERLPYKQEVARSSRAPPISERRSRCRGAAGGLAGDTARDQILQHGLPDEHAAFLDEWATLLRRERAEPRTQDQAPHSGQRPALPDILVALAQHRSLTCAVITRLPAALTRKTACALVLPVHGVKVSSVARAWTLRSSSREDVDASTFGCRMTRTTWRMPPHGHSVAATRCGGAAASQ
jgi:hypothetical protein